MQAFTLRNNPFYLLEVSPRDKRTVIISKAEEKAFFLEDGGCEAAQSALLNPYNRLLAELDWFLDIDKKSSSDVDRCITQNKEISTEGLSPISKINALLFNFSIMQDVELLDIGYMIIDIDEQFGLVQSESIADIINMCRANAGVRPATHAEVEEALRAKRESIRQFFSEKLEKISNEECTYLMTLIADKYVSDSNFVDGTVIFDVLDLYEIRMQSAVDELAQIIFDRVDRIKELSNNEAIKENVLTLIMRIEKWHEIVQPLQARSMVQGISHRDSEAMGRSIRGLSLYLHNEKGLSEVALELVKTAQNFFFNINDVFELLEEDIDTLTDIVERDRAVKQLSRKLDELKQVAERVKLSASTYDINKLIEVSSEANALVKQCNIELQDAITIRKSICFIAREVAVNIHNTRNRTSDSLKIINALMPLFKDIQELKTNLAQDQQTLQRQLTQSLYSPSHSTSSGCYIATCVYGSYDCPQVWILRRFRDQVLGETWYGRMFIRIYYFISPTLVKGFGSTKWFRRFWKERLDRLVERLRNKGVNDAPYVDKQW